MLPSPREGLVVPRMIIVLSADWEVSPPFLRFLGAEAHRWQRAAGLPTL